jgi:hypothetical protein
MEKLLPTDPMVRVVMKTGNVRPANSGAARIRLLSLKVQTNKDALNVLKR